MKAEPKSGRWRMAWILFTGVFVIALGLAVAACGEEAAVEITTEATGLALGAAETGLDPSTATSTSAVGPEKRTLLGDDKPGLVLDSPATGATVSSPIEVTGSTVGGQAVNITVLLRDNQGSYLARGSTAFYNTGDRAVFAFSLTYAQSHAGQTASLVLTTTSAPAGGAPVSQTLVVPVTLE